MENKRNFDVNLGRFEICLNVADLKKSMDFYKMLGFSEIGGDTNYGWAIMMHGNCVMGLFQGHIDKNLLHFRGRDPFEIEKELEKNNIIPNTKAHVEEGDNTPAMEIIDPDDNVIYFNTAPDEPVLKFDIGSLPELDKFRLGRFELCLDVVDMEKSIDFYTRLGFDLIDGNPKDEGWAILKHNNGIVALYEDEKEYMESKWVLNFRGPDVENITNEIKAAGFEMKKEFRAGKNGGGSSTVLDPDGNIVFFDTAHDEPIYEFNIEKM